MDRLFVNMHKRIISLNLLHLNECDAPILAIPIQTNWIGIFLYYNLFNKFVFMIMTAEVSIYYNTIQRWNETQVWHSMTCDQFCPIFRTDKCALPCGNAHSLWIFLIPLENVVLWGNLLSDRFECALCEQVVFRFVLVFGTKFTFGGWPLCGKHFLNTQIYFHFQNPSKVKCF